MGDGEHQADFLDPVQAWDLLDALLEAAPDGTLSREVLARVAEAQDVPLSWVMAAAGMHPALRLADDAPTRVLVCTGGHCQRAGSLRLLDRFLALRAELEAQEAPSFALGTGFCFNQCEHGPCVRVDTPDGMALYRRAGETVLAEVRALLTEADDTGGNASAPPVATADETP